MSSEPITRFAQLALADPVLRAVDEIGYECPSPIQAQSIPALLQGQDLLGQAQTGTGKTAAFALPLLSRLDLRQTQPQLLVLTPTRELALQVAEAMQTYARHLPGFHIAPLYGGQAMSPQLRQLRRGVHVVVGTPGRIQDHLRRGTLKLDQLRSLVLDEADEMLRMGFAEDVQAILEHTPEQKQVALFSATMPPAIKKIAVRHLREPVEIRIQSKTQTVSTIRQRYWQVTGLHKLDALTRILEVEDFDAMIVFVRTKTATLELAEKLEARGFSSAALNGDMNQALREKTIERLKKKGLDILVATDVAARGLDVERISHVINYDIPYDTEAYVHRIGRTGRAGRAGNAILFVAPRERRMLRAIERATGQPIEALQLPSHADIADRRVNLFKQRITDTIEAQELGYFEEIVASYQQEHDISADEIAAALVYLLQKDRPLQPAPEKPRAKSRSAEPKNARAVSEGPRTTRKDRERTAATPVPDEMIRYRIEVGREHGVEPKHIVGAIANEADLESRYIGHIRIHDQYSTVDLPDGMPLDTFRHLSNVWICNRQLRMRVFEGEGAAQTESRAHKPAAKKGGLKAASGTKRAKEKKPSKSKRKRKEKDKGKRRAAATSKP